MLIEQGDKDGILNILNILNIKKDQEIKKIIIKGRKIQGS